jgi:hypothetical protein
MMKCAVLFGLTYHAPTWNGGLLCTLIPVTWNMVSLSTLGSLKGRNTLMRLINELLKRSFVVSFSANLPQVEMRSGTPLRINRVADSHVAPVNEPHARSRPRAPHSKFGYSKDGEHVGQKAFEGNYARE